MILVVPQNICGVGTSSFAHFFDQSGGVAEQCAGAVMSIKVYLHYEPTEGKGPEKTTKLTVPKKCKCLSCSS